MGNEKRWSVQVDIDESDERVTQARARLTERDGEQLVGRGRARRNPRDQDVPRIGDELATARALADLAHELLDTAIGDIEEITHRPAHLRV
jgi:hypothetical protein